MGIYSKFIFDQQQLIHVLRQVMKNRRLISKIFFMFASARSSSLLCREKSAFPPNYFVSWYGFFSCTHIAKFASTLCVLSHPKPHTVSSPSSDLGHRKSQPQRPLVPQYFWTCARYICCKRWAIHLVLQSCVAAASGICFHSWHVCCEHKFIGLSMCKCCTSLLVWWPTLRLLVDTDALHVVRDSDRPLPLQDRCG